jgi:hypothetical protein
MGTPHEHNGYHPAVFLYGSVSAPDAARYWYESAMDAAREANRLREELDRLRKSWIIRLIERYKWN